MSEISPAAASAREAHRDDHGRFGVQPASESSTVTLEPPQLDDATAVRAIRAGLPDGDWPAADVLPEVADIIGRTGRPSPADWDDEEDGPYHEALGRWSRENPGGGPDREALDRIAVDLGTNYDWSADQVETLAGALSDHDSATVDRDRLPGPEDGPSTLEGTRELLVGSGFSSSAVTVHEDHITIEDPGSPGLAIEVRAEPGHDGRTWYSAERVGWSVDRDGQTDDHHHAEVCYDTTDVGVLVTKVTEEAASLDDDGYGNPAWNVWEPPEESRSTTPPPGSAWGARPDRAGDVDHGEPPF